MRLRQSVTPPASYANRKVSRPSGRSWLVVSAALALILSGATRSEAGEPYPIWWSPALEVESIDKVEERLARPLWEDGEGIEVFKGGRDTAPRAVMNTCHSMLALRAQGYEPPGYRPYMLMDHQLA